MARVSGTALSNFFKLYQKMGEPVGKAVRGVGQELAEKGVQQAAKNVVAGKVAGKTAEELAKAGLATGTTQLINLAGTAAEVGAPALGAAYIGGLFDQQNVGTQPFRGRKTYYRVW